MYIDFLCIGRRKELYFLGTEIECCLLNILNLIFSKIEPVITGTNVSHYSIAQWGKTCMNDALNEYLVFHVLFMSCLCFLWHMGSKKVFTWFYFLISCMNINYFLKYDINKGSFTLYTYISMIYKHNYF